jgi:deoxyribonuclease-4
VRPDELGAHVSVAGGVVRAPERAAALDAVVVQVFTKQPSRWAEPVFGPETAAAYRAESARCGLTLTASHDSYLINLASPDAELAARSRAAFQVELERCTALGAEYLVTHPGNATDGDVAGGLARNAEAIERALETVGGETVVLLETTAGAGRVLGSSFEELARLRDGIRPGLRERVAICVDTCHVWAAGYDLVGDYEGVIAAFEAVLGLERLRLFHLNDSAGGRGSHRDRHAAIAAGTLGEAPFRRLMRDARLSHIPKIIETPKSEDMVTADRENLARLRGFREET